MCEGLTDAGLAVEVSVDDVTCDAGLRGLAVNRKPLLGPAESKKYQGMFVAMKRGGNKEVVASGKTYKEVLDSAIAAVGHAFCIIPVPRKGAIFTH